MDVKTLTEKNQILQDLFITGLETHSELCPEVSISVTAKMKDTTELFEADWFELVDTDSDFITGVSNTVFWKNLADYEITEDYDAMDAFNFMQIGILGDVVYG